MGELGVNYATVRIKEKALVSIWRCIRAEVFSLCLCILKYSMMQSDDSKMVTSYFTMETLDTVIWIENPQGLIKAKQNHIFQSSTDFLNDQDLQWF